LKNRGSSAGQNLARGLTGCWGKVVGKHQGIERNSWVALVGAGKAGGGSPARNKGPAVMSNGGDGAPVALAGGNRAWEDKWWPRKLAKGSVWGEEGRRRRLGGGLGGGGGHGVVAPLRVQGEAVGRAGRCTGRERCYLGAELWRRRGRAGVSRRAAKRHTARLGVFVAVARRRPSSACAQGDGAAWRGREASGEPETGKAARARRVAVPAARRQRRERETEKGDGGGAIS